MPWTGTRRRYGIAGVGRAEFILPALDPVTLHVHHGQGLFSGLAEMQRLYEKKLHPSRKGLSFLVENPELRREELEINLRAGSPAFSFAHHINRVEFSTQWFSPRPAGSRRFSCCSVGMHRGGLANCCSNSSVDMNSPRRPVRIMDIKSAR